MGRDYRHFEEPDDELRDDEYSADPHDDDELSETERCPNCGADVYEDAPKCPQCGAWLDADDGDLDDETSTRALRVVLAIFIAFAAASAALVWWLSQ